MSGIGGYMRPKPCSLCGSPADISFVVIASTLRVRPRCQEYSTSVLFCHSCMGVLLSVCSPELAPQSALPLTDALTSTFHALTKRRSLQFNPTKDIGGKDAQSQTTTQPTSGTATDASCRPCLI